MARAITTQDNPYHPIEEFDEWYEYDRRAGYHTPSLLARLAWVSDELGEQENEREINRAIDAILEFDLSGVYVAVDV